MTGWLSCTTGQYDRLYARWLGRSGDLLDLAGWVPGMRLLDLCGGTGAVSLEALRRGATPGSVTLLDLNPRCPDARVRQIAGPAERLGLLLGDWGKFDVVVCRQAISYLRVDERLTAFVWTMLRPGGVFVFNTFARPRWSVKRYAYEGRNYVEASAWFPVPFGTPRVVHLQWCLGSGADVTLFRWYREPELRRALERLFEVDVRRSERGLRWVCTSRQIPAPRG